MKKAILKQVVDDGLVINNRKKTEQLTLNFTDSIDVTEYETIDEKMEHILGSEEILSFMEEYEYKKAYRHFCFFKYNNISLEKIEELVEAKAINVFDKREKKPIDEFDKPTINIMGEQIYFKFSSKLRDVTGKEIKYVVLAIVDKENEIVEFRFDRVGIAYKNSYTYYREVISEKLEYLQSNIDLAIENIDFKAVVDYMKDEKEDITIYAQRMTRNGTTAYLEAYDEESIMPILGELSTFIDENRDLFSKNEYTKEIEKKLKEFTKEIEVKSDMPMVKIRLDNWGIKLGITHNYKDTDYSLFMLYGELSGEKEMMSNVKGYLMQCYREFNSAISADTLPTEEV